MTDLVTQINEKLDLYRKRQMTQKPKLNALVRSLLTPNPLWKPLKAT